MDIVSLPPDSVKPWFETSQVEIYLHVVLAVLVIYDASEFPYHFYLLRYSLMDSVLTLDKEVWCQLFVNFKSLP